MQAVGPLQCLLQAASSPITVLKMLYSGSAVSYGGVLIALSRPFLLLATPAANSSAATPDECLAGIDVALEAALNLSLHSVKRDRGRQSSRGASLLQPDDLASKQLNVFFSLFFPACRA